MATRSVRLLGGRMHQPDTRLTDALADTDTQRERANALAVILRRTEEELADTRRELAIADAEVHQLQAALAERAALPPAGGDLEPAALHDALLAQDAYESLRAAGGVYA